IVSVARNSLYLLDLGASNSKVQPPHFSGAGGAPSRWDGSQTPLHDSMSMRTPLLEDGFRTPMHRQAASEHFSV
ncbi:MAG: hypothetical protein SGPRY_011690, partial [Prymnesium sp.]